jgi:ABC-type transport system involved in multi-copper enzyme maturation permease subunit
MMFVDYLYYDPWGRADDTLLHHTYTVTVLVGLVGLLMVLVRAAGSITAEKERDCWTSLVSTPLSPAQIVWAKIAGSFYSTRLLAVPLILLYGMAVLVRPEFFLLVPVMIATWGVLALYVASLGMLFSLWCRTSVRAMAGSVATAVFFGGGYLLCCMPLFIGSSGDGWEFLFTLCLPMLLGIPEYYFDSHILNPQQFPQNEPKFAVVYILGMGAYFAAALVLTLTCVENLDGFAGRPGGMGGAPLPRRPSRPAHGGQSRPLGAGGVGGQDAH